MSLQALIVCFDCTTRIVHSVELTDHDATSMRKAVDRLTRTYQTKRPQRKSCAKVYPVSGLNMSIKPFLRLKSFHITEFSKLDYMVKELEKEIK